MLPAFLSPSSFLCPASFVFLPVASLFLIPFPTTYFATLYYHEFAHYLTMVMFIKIVAYRLLDCLSSFEI